MQSEGRVNQVNFFRFQPAALDPSRISSSVPILIVIGGATATGKSGLAIALAQRLNSAILSADSRQIYKEFDIGTAKPSPAEQAQAPHYLIDICEPTATLTLAQYQQASQSLIQQVQQTGGVPLLVGGTGLYIDAVVRGLKIPPVAPQIELRSQLTALGQPHCYSLLQQLDPPSAQRIHANDSVRTQRALEVFYVTGQPISHLQGEQPPTYPILYLGLDCETSDTLRHRIETRTHAMLDQGFVAEVERLLQKHGPDLPLMQTLGYAEMLQYLRGDLTLAEAVTLTVQNTRQFAKRQRTWFRNRASVTWLDADAPNLIEQAWDLIGPFLKQITG
ncbi:tRNA (adenosine(37)-N6)-dimethylallyltransferase MiaA [Pseudanabaena sp. FACHB-2040]|uniref:tRNA (adenosine(37)-N6)-dimethylallyltransferase MiaA n=1 Tax=Pseudanabaena sp. FACHB-2040 TaxID=2692859 RepID=UPI0016848C11|nr:tRNA (adenosine(37)-N6)-dimethylallyltransferase MiaA [Pseudanabaena sp. FACHB-2040]MBD2257729.1 tRNA (adenosine(37)-N6)-dimethylallyltransferase MiaA [Pseudanabaena sp. FACHB-2040]